MAVLLAGISVAGSAAAAAQNPCEDFDGNAELDEKIRSNYGKDDTVKIAVEAGKQYLEKFGSCEAFKDFSDWVKAQMPKWEKRAKDHEEWMWLKPRIERFDGGIRSGKYDDTYAAGKEILAKYPDNMNQMVPMGLIGLYESYKQNYKFNDDTLRFAKMAIDKLKGGVASTKPNGNYGAFQFERSKTDAISELTYTIAYINYHVKKDRKAALPLYYEASQLPGPYKEEPRLYATLGGYYVDESNPIGEEIIKLVKAQELATTDEEKEKFEGEIKAKVALYNGYIERALDAFGRAHKVADDKIASEKTLKAEVYKTMQALYEKRFEKKDGLDTWISAAVAKPMPNPTTEVRPVQDPEPVTTSATTTGTAANVRP